MFVSPALVTIENFALHEGQAKKTPRDPSSGFSTFSETHICFAVKAYKFHTYPSIISPGGCYIVSGYLLLQKLTLSQGFSVSQTGGSGEDSEGLP